MYSFLTSSKAVIVANPFELVFIDQIQDVFIELYQHDVPHGLRSQKKEQILLLTK
ncbi:hypothetical protein [Pectobacterium aroidearum]|uniref:hypothetical protein n=1 Tax=Pectobacterium aroidearum TaxID=1201031 RepID=UPI0032EFA410